MTWQRFATESDLRAWFEANHALARELWLRLRKTSAAGPGVTYAEALDLALCHGWIDGVRRAVDSRSYAIRFSPRQPRSIWSKVNLRHYERLERSGRVTAAGKRAFQERDPARSGLYSFESRPRQLPPGLRRIFRADAGAWAFFSAQAPSYRRTAIFWVVSAKQETTRQRRLAQLIADSAHGRRLKMLARPSVRRPAEGSGGR